MLLAAVASSVLTIGVAAAQSPVPSPAPTATATATPPPGPIYNGRACGVGTVINDFLVVQEPPPGPVATCLEPVSPSAPARLYRLKSVPSGLVFAGVEHDDRGHSFVVYRSAGDPAGSSTVQIIVTEGHRDPDPIILRDASAAAGADFLPVPGIAIRDLNNSSATWHEGGRGYMLIIDGAKTDLTLEEVAALLEPFTPPGPPTTGNTVNGARSEGMPWQAVLLAGGALTGIAGSAVVYQRKRTRQA